MRYLTDEELLNLVEEIEAEPLFAPKYLKTEIMEKIDMKNIKWWQGNFVYNVKIIAGMAAALVLIFTLPREMNFGGLDKILNISTTAVNDTSMKFIDTIKIFDGLFEMKGENYEYIKKE